MNAERLIFRRGSTTYYFSSRFFPASVRSDVLRLYSFVRIADNYVDERPVQPKQLLALDRRWRRAYADAGFDTTVRDSDDIDTRVLKNMVHVARKYAFDPTWIEDFLAAMKADIDPKPYKSLDETLGYVHGSAEVIGLMMARILRLPPAVMRAAAMQGRAMQYINFIRDIAEDTALGRCYFPADELRAFGLSDLREETARTSPEAFEKFVRYQLGRYTAWQHEAASGFRYMSKRYRIPVRTAADMYGWTASQIAADPFIVFNGKTKPSRRRVISRAVLRMFYG